MGALSTRDQAKGILHLFTYSEDKYDFITTLCSQDSPIWSPEQAEVMYTIITLAVEKNVITTTTINQLKDTPCQLKK